VKVDANFDPHRPYQHGRRAKIIAGSDGTRTPDLLRDRQAFQPASSRQNGSPKQSEELNLPFANEAIVHMLGSRVAPRPNHLPDRWTLNKNTRGQKGADKANDLVLCALVFSGTGDNRILGTFIVDAEVSFTE